MASARRQPTQRAVRKFAAGLGFVLAASCAVCWRSISLVDGVLVRRSAPLLAGSRCLTGQLSASKRRHAHETSQAVVLPPRQLGCHACGGDAEDEPPSRRLATQQFLTGVAALGWAGWLGEGGTRLMSRPAHDAAFMAELESATAAAQKLGLTATYLEDATGWEVSFFADTLHSVDDRCPRSFDVVYHYTTLDAAEAILKGRRGLRVSRGGYRGGGVYFSRGAPTDVEDMKDKGSLLWRDVFPSFREVQLRNNYGSDTTGREKSLDAVLVCVVPRNMLDPIPDRPEAAFIAVERLDTFSAEYFSARNIVRAYRLAPRR
mmetsp:Transcript_27560/g.91481  ORF Transcript_27560/g.91481 Transcript_27560/m.91481 type:complete len:318 (+) Transcript_27560:65-1018(+)